jgi:hypothetical protein
MSPWAAPFLAVAATLLSQEERSPPPKQPAEPFRIIVFSDPRGEPEAVARVRDAESACHKTLKRRKKWFAAVSDRQQAEIVMEIKASWMEERMITERSPMSGTPINTAREHHTLLAEVSIFGGHLGLRSDDRPSVKAAASSLMDELEEFCKKNYWEILRQRPADGR